MAEQKTPVATAEKPKVTPEEAMQVLQEQQKKEADACAAEISEVLKKHGMRMVVQNQIQVIKNQT